MKNTRSICLSDITHKDMGDIKKRIEDIIKVLNEDLGLNLKIINDYDKETNPNLDTIIIRYVP